MSLRITQNLNVGPVGVAVIASPLHGEGHQFDPGTSHLTLYFFYFFADLNCQACYSDSRMRFTTMCSQV